MKIKNILFISLVIGIGILIFLIVLNVIKKEKHNDKLINDVVEESIDNTKNKNDYSTNDKKNFKVNNNENNTHNLGKDYNKERDNVNDKKNEVFNTDLLIADDDRVLIKDTYYYQSNWIVEEIVISEEKESLSFFEKLDGKKAKVTKSVTIYTMRLYCMM